MDHTKLFSKPNQTQSLQRDLNDGQNKESTLNNITNQETPSITKMAHKDESPDIIIICDEDDIKLTNLNNRKISCPIQKLTNQMDCIFESSYASPNSAIQNNSTILSSLPISNQVLKNNNAYSNSMISPKQKVILNSTDINDKTDFTKHNNNLTSFKNSSFYLAKNCVPDYNLNSNELTTQYTMSLKYSGISKIANKDIKIKRLNTNGFEKKSFSKILQETEESRFKSQKFSILNREIMSLNKNSSINEIELIDLT